MAESSHEAAAAGAPSAPAVYYVLKNVMRGRLNRTARVSQPGRRAFTQKLAGSTVVVRRARPVRISEEMLKKHFKEIQQAVAEHRIVVTTPSGQLVDLKTLMAAPPSPDKALPNFVQDSVKNDRNQGIGYNIPPTPEGTGLNAEEPELLQQLRLEEADPSEPPELLDSPPSLAAPLVEEVVEEPVVVPIPETVRIPEVPKRTIPQQTHKRRGRGK